MIQIVMYLLELRVLQYTIIYSDRAHKSAHVIVLKSMHNCESETVRVGGYTKRSEFCKRFTL